MKRIFIDNLPQKASGLVQISGDLHKHLSVVLRARVGQSLQVCDGCGNVFLGEISSFSKDKTLVKILEKLQDFSEPQIKVDMFLSILKGAPMDFAIQKSVELGAFSLQPMVTENTVKTDLSLERAQKISLESAQQSGRAIVPKIKNPQKLGQLLADLKEYDLVIFPFEKAETMGLKQFLETAISSKQDLKTVAIVIGPEGGFSDSEAETLSKITTPISLGQRILRADTAAAATLAATMFQLGQLERRAHD